MVITDIMNPFYGAMTGGAEDVLAREGYTLLVGNTDNEPQKEDSYYRAFVAKRVDDLLLITSPAEYPPVYLSRHNTERRHNYWPRPAYQLPKAPLNLGYKRALHEHRVPVKDKPIRDGQFDIRTGHEQAKWLLTLRARPTALFAFNAAMSMGACGPFLTPVLKCPEDVALVSFDDME
jgi:LacI family transcriptional regulator